MAKDPTRTEQAERRQVAALPWRHGAGGVEILLVTSRETRRWVTPKGGRMSGKTDAEAAAQEALEEAGIEGVVSDKPIGTFRYLKVLKRRASRWCVVSLYGLEVTAEHGDWQERDERERVWVSREEAASRVDEPDLKALIASFDP
ncbi:8-oxo-dGTP pyrophosphatase MutT (NUDIX family) [Brevundimonas alba]|uniref:8-oxo-dGTP pyrophosphatase MutT (NUDIX family) n=1 Tax=Brevundimonas alba TaxID=74314 RepID=A0A7X5YLF1_9CAUL|nr:NUDIX hydrolase [Brevundimonas alba]NJC41792.1 8-oxo-dGTP pyrophosphatase MutT (NUDIX family) [Brevundimonas alba]